MKLTQWPKKDRPREKLLRLGADSLSDSELLAIFLRTGVKGSSAVDLAHGLLTEYGSLRGLLAAREDAFCKGKGLGQAKYVQIKAVIEMAKRYFAENLSRNTVLCSVQDTRMFLISQLRDEPNEVFAVMALDSQHRMINFKKLFYGTINAASVYPRVLVTQALEDNAAAIILAHNHPSGVAEPSMADREITNKISAAMSLVDIKVLDHFVIGDGYAVSFAERGYI